MDVSHSPAGPLRLLRRLTAPTLLLLLGALALAGAAGLALGLVLSDGAWRERAARVLHRLAPERAAHTDIARQSAPWRMMSTSLHDIEIAEIALAPFNTFGRGGALEEIEGNIVFVSPVGEIGYITPGMEMRRLDLAVDLNLDELRQSEIYRRPGFVNLMFRVLDMLAVRRGEGRYDLYVSHHRFAGNCFEIVISRAPITASPTGLAAGAFEDFYVTQPCIPPKDRNFVFEGNETGGRMALRDPQTLLLTLGDADFNGVNDERMWAQDPHVDYGKILAIDIASGRSRIYTMGSRNPQGLLVAGDGVIWETEHGPRGGDEINIVVEGRNFGWPRVTYGANYNFSGPRRTWPLASTPGRHEGYDRPVFVFTPAIGISNLIEPNVREFPHWRDHLLVGSLHTGRQLYLVRVRDRAVMYVEPIPIDAISRDMISLRDGRIAIVTDAGRLLLVRNADDEDTGPLTVTASGELQRWLQADAGAYENWAETYGEQLFVERCLACHSLAGATGVGPPLDGVIGRDIAGVPSFAYSPGLSGRDGAWTEAALARYLLDPQAEAPGTTMPELTMSRREAAEITDFLKTQR